MSEVRQSAIRYISVPDRAGAASYTHMGAEKGVAGLERQLSEISDALARAAAEQEEAESRRGLQKQERPSQPIDVETDALTRDTAEQEEADSRRRSEQESQPADLPETDDWTPCPMCRGRGRYETASAVSVDCPQCESSGALKGLWTKCSKCSGLGLFNAVGGSRMRCDACDGSGALPGLDWCRCWACSGLGMPGCSVCCGKGSTQLSKIHSRYFKREAVAASTETDAYGLRCILWPEGGAAACGGCDGVAVQVERALQRSRRVETLSECSTSRDTNECSISFTRFFSI